MTYSEFVKVQLKRQQLELFFVRIKGIGRKTASTIASHLLSLPKEKRVELAKLIAEGDMEFGVRN